MNSPRIAGIFPPGGSLLLVFPSLLLFCTAAHGATFDLADSNAWPTTIVTGTAQGLSPGEQSLTRGDFNGDGCDDLATGLRAGTPAGAEEMQPGVVAIYFGGSSALSPEEGQCAPPAISPQIVYSSDPAGVRPVEDTYFAWRLAAGDLNGDGLADLAIAEPGASEDRGVSQMGRIWILLGTPEGLLHPKETTVMRAADVVLEGSQANQLLGWGLANAGDVDNRDGACPGCVDDLWIANGASAAGVLFLFPGSLSWVDGEQVVQTQPDQVFQVSYGSAKITDGFARALATRWGANGPTLLLGDTFAGGGYRDGVLFEIPIQLGVTVEAQGFEVATGPTDSDAQLGSSVAVVDDGAEGHIWIGGPRYGEECGVSWRGLLVSPGEGQQYAMSSYPLADLGLGTALTTLPDLDGDGTEELVASSRGYCWSNDQVTEVPGEIYLIRSRDLGNASQSVSDGACRPDSQSAAWELPRFDTWRGAAASDCLGAAIVSGDFNGDGHPDLASLTPTGASRTGELSVLWSISDIFSQDGDAFIPYVGSASTGEPPTLYHDSGDLVPVGDCNDSDPSIFPGQLEQCDGIDQNCYAEAPLPDQELMVEVYSDRDGDGYGAGESHMACAPEAGESNLTGDCNDQDANVHPPGDLEESLCNGVDDDCDGAIDEGALLLFYPDGDGDGHGDKGADPIEACAASAGYSATSHDDCNDKDGAVNPGAEEVCGPGDARDDNCDGTMAPDEVDVDKDHALVCAGECDDANPSVYPGADQLPDQCDIRDADCDGVDDPGKVDGDGDHVTVCEGDCDDSDPCRYPGPRQPVVDQHYGCPPFLEENDPLDLDCDNDDWSPGCTAAIKQGAGGCGAGGSSPSQGGLPLPFLTGILPMLWARKKIAR